MTGFGFCIVFTEEDFFNFGFGLTFGLVAALGVGLSPTVVAGDLLAAVPEGDFVGLGILLTDLAGDLRALAFDGLSSAPFA